MKARKLMILKTAEAVSAEMSAKVDEKTASGIIEAGVYDPTRLPDIDSDAVEKIPTGIQDLDEALHGGIYTGGYTVLTSTEGTGKTTFTAQLIRGALESGYSAMVMSDEDGVNRFNAQFLRACAGPRGIDTSNRDRFIPEVYPDVKKYINAYYRGRLFFLAPYDLEQKDRNWKGILAKLKAYAKAGVKFFVLDNLMTLTSFLRRDSVHTTNDVNDAQMQICSDLRELGITYNVAIVLIQHKRKMPAGTTKRDINNDDGSGSADVKNMSVCYMHWMMFQEKTEIEKQNERIKRRIADKTGVKEEDLGKTSLLFEEPSEDETAETKRLRKAIALLQQELLGDETDRRLIVGKERLYGPPYARITLRYDPSTLRYYRTRFGGETTEVDMASSWEAGYYTQYLPRLFKERFGIPITTKGMYQIPKEVQAWIDAYKQQQAEVKEQEKIGASKEMESDPWYGMRHLLSILSKAGIAEVLPFNGVELVPELEKIAMMANGGKGGN